MTAVGSPDAPGDELPAGDETSDGPVDLETTSWLRTILVMVGSLVVMLAVATFSLSRGEPNASLAEVWQSVWGTEPTPGVFIEVLVRELRYPRVIIAIMAGLSLGMSGVTLQDSLRNPLADPYLLGIAQGAGFVVAVASIYPELSPGVPVTILCLIGGALSGGLVLALSKQARNPVRVVLSGAMISLLLGTMSTVVVLLAPTNRASGILGYFRFVIGSFAGVQWDSVGTVIWWFVPGVILVLGSARILNLLQLGDEAAAGLGINPGRARLWLMFVSLILVAPYVAVIGPIGFVALFAPHMSRSLLATNDARRLLPVAGMIGATLLIIADTAGRLAFFPIETPAGLFTWTIVGPIALVLVGRLGKRAT
ncbi:MAG: iron ABC transporter permease [Actinomycetota bacterium]